MNWSLSRILFASIALLSVTLLTAAEPVKAPPVPADAQALFNARISMDGMAIRVCGALKTGSFMAKRPRKSLPKATLF